MHAIEWKNICCPVDFSAPAKRAVQAAADMSHRLGADLTLLHVETAGDKWSEEQAQEFKHEAEKHGATNVRLVRHPGDPAARIVEYSKHGGYSLIVMGTHGRTGRAASLVGSVAESVVRHAHCPVLTVK